MTHVLGLLPSAAEGVLANAIAIELIKMISAVELGREVVERSPARSLAVFRQMRSSSDFLSDIASRVLALCQLIPKQEKGLCGLQFLIEEFLYLLPLLEPPFVIRANNKSQRFPRLCSRHAFALILLPRESTQFIIEA